MDDDKLKYPIGKFIKPTNITSDIILAYINDIELFPSKLKAEVEHLSDLQLNTPYRPNGWTVRQVVNHCADSHMNSLIRFKLALTEKRPTIKPYQEAEWAELEDSRNISITPALELIAGLHKRWVVLLRSLTKTDLEKTFIHPESRSEISLDENIGMYAWHGNHHLAHITTLKKMKHWS